MKAVKPAPKKKKVTKAKQKVLQEIQNSESEDDIPRFVVRKIVNSRVVDGLTQYKCLYVGLDKNVAEWHTLGLS